MKEYFNKSTSFLRLEIDIRDGKAQIELDGEDYEMEEVLALLKAMNDVKAKIARSHPEIFKI